MKAARRDPSVPAGRVSISLMNVGSLLALRFSSRHHPFLYFPVMGCTRINIASLAPADPPRRLTSSKRTSLAIPPRLPHPSTPLTAPLWTVCFETASFVLRYFLFLWLSPRNSPFELPPRLPFPPRPLIFPSLPPADCHHRAGITPVSSHTSRHTGETCAGVKHGEGALLNLISQAGSH